IRDRKAVTLRIAGTPALALAGTPVRPLADLPGLASVAFAYFGAEDGKSAAGWHASWQDRKHLPALIRIKAHFAPHAHLNWPTLIIAPRIEADAGCSIDLLTKDCQGR
ncbi:MAG: hypothetical protein KGL26_14150, partial [Pseudomonadota bacterium]|nr:hypothetical protein [Pseudomonadota bacterium]